MADIPRARQRKDPTAKKPFIRRKVVPTGPPGRADLTEAKITQEKAKGTLAVAELLGTLAERQQKFDGDKLTTQAAGISSRLQDEMVGFTADALTMTGNDAVGIDEYNTQFDKSISAILKEQGLEGSKIGDVVRFKTDKFSARLKEKLANHQEKEQVTSALNSVDSIVETSKIQANLFPESVDDIIAETNSSIDAVKDIIGSDKAEQSKNLAETSIKSNMIMTVALTDMDEAEELLSTHRATLPKEAVSVIEKELKRITKQNEENLKKANEKAAEDWRAEDNKRRNSDNPMTIPEIELAPIGEKERTNRLKAAENEPTKFEETDEAYRAEVSTNININPKLVNPEKDIWDKVGLGKKGGLSTNDAQALQNKLNTNIKAQKTGESQRSPQEKTAYTALNNAKTSKLFDPENPAINITEWSKQTRALDSFIENNPDEDPVKYVDTILAPIKQEQSGAIVRFFTREPKAPEVIESPTERRIATKLLTEQGVDIGDVTEERITETVEVRNLAIDALEAEGFPVNPENIQAAMKQISKSLETVTPEGDIGVGF